MSQSKGSTPKVSSPIKPPGPPKVWKVLDVKRGNAKVPTRFSIQEIPEDRYDDVLEHMCTHFMREEPICKSINGKDDPSFVAGFRHLWEESLRLGLSIGAFTENPNGGKPILAGVNVISVAVKDEELDEDEFDSEMGKVVTKIIMDLTKDANVFEKYGVDKYMIAFGLSVHPSYRGHALGAHILNARVDVGREYGFSVTTTAFTSPISQKLAERCGFETLIQKDYEDMLDENGKPIFVGIESKTLKIMGRKLC